MTEALVGEKDTETRINMVELVIVALLKVFLVTLPFFSQPVVQDSKSRWESSFSYSAIPLKCYLRVRHAGMETVAVLGQLLGGQG